MADPGRRVGRSRVHPQGYSAEGYRRLVALAAELQRLRSRLGQPLPDLVADVERTVGLDVEAAAGRRRGPRAPGRLRRRGRRRRGHRRRPARAARLPDHRRRAGGRPGAGRDRPRDRAGADPDRARGQGPGVGVRRGAAPVRRRVPRQCQADLARRRRPATAGAARRPGRHPRPGPARPAGTRRSSATRSTPTSRSSRPTSSPRSVGCSYVALTRAEHTLLFSAHHWPVGTVNPKGPGAVLHGAGRSRRRAARGPWPRRRPRCEQPVDRRAADGELAGRSAGRAPTGGDGGGGAGADRPRPDGGSACSTTCSPDDPFGWERDVSALLAERAAAAAPVDRRRPARVDCRSPRWSTWPTTRQALARRIRRPIPTAPAPQARRGTAFHAWLEHRYGAAARCWTSTSCPARPTPTRPRTSTCPGCRTRSWRRRWADRVPVEVEVPFATRVAGLGLRGRIDAVFADPDGGCTVIDWKTGRVPAPDRQAAAAVQLAAYRLAWSRLSGLPLELVRAAFHYVAGQPHAGPGGSAGRRRAGRDWSPTRPWPPRSERVGDAAMLGPRTVAGTGVSWSRHAGRTGPR